MNYTLFYCNAGPYRLADGLALGLGLSETDTDGLTLGEMLGEIDGDILALAGALGEIDGDSEALGEIRPEGPA